MSKLIKEAFLINKGKFLKGAELSCSIFEDLTVGQWDLFNDVKKRPDTAKVWTHNGRVKFVKKGKLDEVLTARLD